MRVEDEEEMPDRRGRGGKGTDGATSDVIPLSLEREKTTCGEEEGSANNRGSLHLVVPARFAAAASAGGRGAGREGGPHAFQGSCVGGRRMLSHLCGASLGREFPPLLLCPEERRNVCLGREELL